MKNWSWVSDGRLTPRWTGRLTVGRNVTSTSSEKALKITNPQLSKRNFKEKEKLVTGPRWAPDTKTDWPTDRRSQCNLKLNLHYCTSIYRTVLSSERPPYMKYKESNCHSNKCNIWTPAPRGARHQDELAD
jgi:hypothetical protein